VEGHRGLSPSGTALAAARVFSHRHLTSQLRPSTFQGRPVTRLSDALQIVYTAAHWAFEFKGIGGALAMLDLIYLMKYTKEAIDWEAIFDGLDGSVAAAHLYLMLTVATITRHFESPHHAQAGRPPSHRRPPIRAFVQRLSSGHHVADPAGAGFAV
jgi:hypothetical protein